MVIISWYIKLWNTDFTLATCIFLQNFQWLFVKWGSVQSCTYYLWKVIIH